MQSSGISRASRRLQHFQWEDCFAKILEVFLQVHIWTHCFSFLQWYLMRSRVNRKSLPTSTTMAAITLAAFLSFHSWTLREKTLTLILTSQESNTATLHENVSNSVPDHLYFQEVIRAFYLSEWHFTSLRWSLWSSLPYFILCESDLEETFNFTLFFSWRFSHSACWHFSLIFILMPLKDCRYAISSRRNFGTPTLLEIFGLEIVQWGRKYVGRSWDIREWAI